MDKPVRRCIWCYNEKALVYDDIEKKWFCPTCNKYVKTYIDEGVKGI